MDKIRVPPVGKYLIKFFAPKIRKHALHYYLKSHGQTKLPVDFLRDELGYGVEEEDEFIAEIIEGYKIILSDDDLNQIDCKKSLASFERLEELERQKNLQQRSSNYNIS